MFYVFIRSRERKAYEVVGQYKEVFGGTGVWRILGRGNVRVFAFGDIVGDEVGGVCKDLVKKGFKYQVGELRFYFRDKGRVSGGLYRAYF